MNVMVQGRPLTSVNCGITIGRTVVVGFLLLALLLAGCRNVSQAADGNFVDLYVELKVATVAFSEDIEKAGEARRIILAQHGMTPEEFRAHYQRLLANPASWRAFQNEVVRKMDEFQTSQKGENNGV